MLSNAIVVHPTKKINGSVHPHLTLVRRSEPREVPVSDLPPDLPAYQPAPIGPIQPQIADRTRKFLESETWEGYDSQERQDYAIVLGLVNSHFSDEQIEQIMLDYPTRFRRKHEVYRTTATGWLRRSLKKARSLEDSEATKQRRAKIRKAQDVLPHIDLPNKRTADTDRQLLRALLEVAYEVGSYEFRKDMRSLAIIALMKAETAGAALNRLVEAGILTKDGWNSFGTRIKLDLDVILEKCQHGDSNHAVEDGYCTVVGTFWAHEVFCPKRFGKGSKHAKGSGLGRTCRVLYQWLAESPMSAAELQRVSGKSRRTVFRSLDKMKNIVDSTGEIHSLVEKKNGLYQISATNLDELSRVLGTEGKRRRVRTIYQTERDQNRRRQIPRQGM